MKGKERKNQPDNSESARNHNREEQEGPNIKGKRS
jgi:hypothetical protein